MARLGVFAALLVAAALAAALFGALHDQVSYTVAPDYYRLFKFDQFAIPNTWPERLGAAWVGVQASWWMGPLVGLLPFLLGLVILRDARRYARAGLLAIACVLGLTALASGTGLLLETLSPTGPGIWWVPEGADAVAFLRAGAMHNAAYLGGALGLVAALLVMGVAAWRGRRAVNAGRPRSR